jgi:hypothetical protein
MTCGRKRSEGLSRPSADRCAGLAFDLPCNGQMISFPFDLIASTIWVLIDVPIREWLRFKAP